MTFKEIEKEISNPIKNKKGTISVTAEVGDGDGGETDNAKTVKSNVGFDGDNIQINRKNLHIASTWDKKKKKDEMEFYWGGDVQPELHDDESTTMA